MTCEHLLTASEVDVTRLFPGTADARWHAVVEIRCVDCGIPFRFVGLPTGMDANGAGTSADGTQGLFTVYPTRGEPSGFRIPKTAEARK